MIGFRDQTFCIASCKTTVCFRHTIHLRHNTENLPVAMSDFSKTCTLYIPEETVHEHTSPA